MASRRLKDVIAAFAVNVKNHVWFYIVLSHRINTVKITVCQNAAAPQLIYIACGSCGNEERKVVLMKELWPVRVEEDIMAAFLGTLQLT